MTGHRFQIDLAGLIRLLSDNLYSKEDVFVRELLQNALDAHTARREAGIRPQEAGTIHVYAPGDGTLRFEDDGVGLTEEEIHRFLATIGQSSKRLHQRPAGDFLGQFGIGLLACFVVSETIEVTTRSAREPNAPAHRWLGRDDGTYELSKLDTPHSPGTRVRLVAKPSFASFFEPERVRDSLKHYGVLLPCSIELRSPGGTARIDAPAPWRQSDQSPADRREAIMRFGRERFGVDFLDYVELRSKVGEVEGVAYVLRHATATGARRADLVFLKGMLLSEATERLLPDWAFFVKAVADVRGLVPLANREAFVENDALDAVRMALGSCLKDYLRTMAEERPEHMQALLRLHHHPIKQLASEDSEFLLIVARWLPFESSAGRLALGDCLRLSPTIRFARTVDTFREVAPFIAAHHGLVINAGYSFDLEILVRYAALAEIEVEEVTASSLVEGFAELDPLELEEARLLCRIAEHVLEPFGCAVRIKRFLPSNLPALYTVPNDALFKRSAERTKELSSELWSGVLDDLVVSQPAHDPPTLTLNYDNPMIQRLVLVDDPELRERLIEVLYLQTLMLGHHPLSGAEMNLVSQSVSGLMEWSMSGEPRRLQ